MRGLGYLLLDSRVELLLVGRWVRCRGFEVGVAAFSWRGVGWLVGSESWRSGVGGGLCIPTLFHHC